MAAVGPLHDRGIVVTRPRQQASGLMTALSALGARPILFPVLEIAPLDDPGPLAALAPALADFDLAFFVSPNAVEHTLAAIPPAQWPQHLRVATIGPASRQALLAHGFRTVISPQQGFDSEAVLNLPAFAQAAVAGKRVLILRGEGGRELLADTLRQRGAVVECVTSYQRRCATTDAQPLLDECSRGRVDALTFTSSEGARYFADLLGADRKMLLSLPCFAPHERIVNQLRALGAAQAIPADAGDDGLVAALQRHFG